MTHFGGVNTTTVLDRSKFYNYRDVNHGASSPSSTLQGTTPEVITWHITAAGPTVACVIPIPAEADRTVDMTWRWHLALSESENDGDVWKWQFYYITAQGNIGISLGKTANSVTGELTATTAKGLSPLDRYTLDHTLAYNDATNPLADADLLAVHIERQGGSAPVRRMHVLGGELFYRVTPSPFGAINTRTDLIRSQAYPAYSWSTTTGSVPIAGVPRSNPDIRVEEFFATGSTENEMMVTMWFPENFDKTVDPTIRFHGAVSGTEVDGNSVNFDIDYIALTAHDTGESPIKASTNTSLTIDLTTAKGVTNGHYYIDDLVIDAQDPTNPLVNADGIALQIKMLLSSDPVTWDFIASELRYSALW